MDLKRGSIGWLVKMLQEDLDLIGYNLKVDGVFGPLTEQAVKDLQIKSKIAVDGKVASQTWGVIESLLDEERLQLTAGHRDDANHKLLTTITGSVMGNAFFFVLEINDQNIQFLLDTGAFKLMFAESVGKMLMLPDLGTIEVSGVGGMQLAYSSKVTFKLGDTVFTGIPCIVDEANNFAMNLFGLEFFDDEKLTLDLDLSQAQAGIGVMSIYQLAG